VDGQPAVSVTPQINSVVGLGSTKSNIVQQPPKDKAHNSIAKVDLKSQNVVKDVKNESNGTGNTIVHDNINKHTAEKEKSLPLPTGKKKVQADKNGSVTGGSLASFWGRPSAKPKSCSVPAENSNTISNPSGWFTFQFIEYAFLYSYNSNSNLTLHLQYSYNSSRNLTL
jgi:DNA polymerase delta subunit 3